LILRPVLSPAQRQAQLARRAADRAAARIAAGLALQDLAASLRPLPLLGAASGHDPDPPLLGSLYRLLGPQAILAALADSGAASARLRRLPAHEVVWLVIAMSLFRDRSVPMVWRHVHPSCDDHAQPTDAAFTHARKRLGALPMKLLFERTCLPLAPPATMPGARHGSWVVTALDGVVFETPDSPANRRAFGSASNQHGAGAFPQARLAALCEVGTHAITDVEIGRYDCSEQELALRVLCRLAAGLLVLMDRGLSYYELIEAVLGRGSQVLARVKVSRALPVQKELPDGSYVSTIYSSYNERRAGRGGVKVRVIRYSHDDPSRDGSGEMTVLITTVLDVSLLSARQAVALYPWRWEEESVFAEIKGTMLRNGQPLLRSKSPGLAVQELYGMLIGHYLVRREMYEAARGKGVAAVRVSFKRSVEVLEDRMRDGPTAGWLVGLRKEVGRQKLQPRRPRRYPRVKKATRSRWPNKKPGSKPPSQPTRPFHEVVRIMLN
jgi:hypothetical protein